MVAGPRTIRRYRVGLENAVSKFGRSLTQSASNCVQNREFPRAISGAEASKPTASTGSIERAMGIEQIQMTPNKGVTTRSAVQLESNGVKLRSISWFTRGLAANLR